MFQPVSSKVDFPKIEENILGKIKPFHLGGSRISKGVFFDTSNGPIVINSGTKILPFNYLAGPLYIGSNCQVNEHSSLKHSCIGNTCKVGGEIEATIFQG